MKRSHVLCLIALLAIGWLPLLAVDATPPKIAAFFSPHGGYEKGAADCVTEVVRQVANAKKTIYVRAYGFSSQPIGEALATAAKRGVSVRVICDRSVRSANGSIVPACQAAGCEVVFDENHPISHSKVMVIDAQTSLVGSYNWTGQAERNAETMLVIHDRDLAKSLIRDWEHHREHSVR